MTTLASAVSIGDNQLLIDTPLAAGQVPGWVKIDSEMLNVGGQHFRTGTTLVLSEPAKATHNSGATVTYAGRPFDPTFVAATAGEGGAAEAGTVVAQLTGTETEYGHLYRGDEDPDVDFSAELEPGDLWIDTTFGPPYSHKERNGTNDGWQIAASYVYTAGILTAVIQASDQLVTAQVFDEATGLQAIASLKLESPGGGEGGVTISAFDENGDGAAQILLNNASAHKLTLAGGAPQSMKNLILDETGLMLDGDVIGTQAAAVADAASDDPADLFTTLNALLAALRASKELAT